MIATIHTSEIAESGSQEPVPGTLLYYSPDEAARILGISRTRVFALILEGELPSIKVGNRRRISWWTLRGYARQVHNEAVAALEMISQPTKKRATRRQSSRTKTRSVSAQTNETESRARR
jgi:excisionase family DNA binding protein